MSSRGGRSAASLAGVLALRARCPRACNLGRNTSDEGGNGEAGRCARGASGPRRGFTSHQRSRHHRAPPGVESTAAAKGKTMLASPTSEPHAPPLAALTGNRRLASGLPAHPHPARNSRQGVARFTNALRQRHKLAKSRTTPGLRARVRREGPGDLRYRWYGPGTGEYNSPDPMGLASVAELPAQPTDDPELFSPWYIYAGANPVNYLDPLGLLRIKGCSKEDEASVVADFKDYCEQVNQNGFKDCLCEAPDIPGGLKKRCANLETTIVRCKPKETGRCEGNCAWTYTRGRKIRLCPSAFRNKGCGPVGCTLMHELTHQLGHGGEEWPRTVEKCLGCP